MKVSITQSIANKAKAKDKPYEVRDTKLTGFLLRVQPTGRKTYYCEYRRGARIKIGPESALDVKSARKKAKETLAQYYQGGEPAITKKKTKAIPTYKEFLKKHYFPWVEVNHSSPKSSKRRLENDCSEFLKIKLDAITPQKVEKWRTAKVARGLSPHTANRCYNALRAALNKAEEWGIIPDHPFRKMKPMKADSNLNVRYLTQEEETRLRNALERREERMRADRVSGNQWRQARNISPMIDLSKLAFCDHLMPMVLLTVNTGLRRGEMLSLRWNNVDFQLKQITIEATNAKSRRIRHIPLNEEAFEVLSKLQSQSKIKAVFVFENHQGKPFTDIKKSWKTLLKSAKIDEFRWHDLRHHFASKLAMNGVELNTIRELLGHSSYEMTLRYAHLSAGHKADAVSRLV